MSNRLLAACAVVVLVIALPHVAGAAVPVARTYSDGTDGDQDDMCFWVHPIDPSLTTVIGSDKGMGNLYVYDLDGSVIQTVATGKPGNIDVRYGIELGGDCVDLVAFNERAAESIFVYRVDPATRTLERVDDGQITTSGTYGFTLFRHADGRLFGYTGPKGGGVSQYELFDDGAGRISARATGWFVSSGTTCGGRTSTHARARLDRRCLVLWRTLRGPTPPPRTRWAPKMGPQSPLNGP